MANIVKFWRQTVTHVHLWNWIIILVEVDVWGYAGDRNPGRVLQRSLSNETPNPKSSYCIVYKDKAYTRSDITCPLEHPRKPSAVNCTTWSLLSHDSCHFRRSVLHYYYLLKIILWWMSTCGLPNYWVLLYYSGNKSCILKYMYLYCIYI